MKGSGLCITMDTTTMSTSRGMPLGVTINQRSVHKPDI